MGGMTREQALDAIALVYTSPITAYYGEEATLLLPEMIDLSLDMAATAQNLDEALATQVGVQSFFTYALDQILRREPEPLAVKAIVNYSRERVDAFMDRIAQKYDHPPQNPVSLPEAGTFRPARAGTELDLDASRPLLIEAVLSADTQARQVHLVVKTEPAPEVSIDLLGEAIGSTLREFDGIAGIFIKDLNRGKELCLNCDVAFSGLSTLKIGIVLELYRTLDAPPAPETTSLISETLTASDNASANLLLLEIGAGNPYSGALQVTELFSRLSLHNTFMAAPYDLKDGALASNRITPANSRTDISTNPDPYIQTTPTEIGLLLEGVHQCAQGGGFLRALYPQQITPGDCQDILAWMEYNRANLLLTAEIPEGIRTAHKQGWAGETHADLSLVYSPGGDFVMAVFLYQPEWLVWEESAPTFAAIGKLAYRFFNGDE